MPAPGDLLADRYRIVAPLGAGGMATVHRAHDERLERDVAVKVLLPNLAADPVTAQRFEREARAMAAVAHPGLVAVFDVDAGDPAVGREPFVVMELCPGGSLADRMGTGRPLPPDELVPILVAVADALGALHHAGLVHRDVKPSNILFAADRVKLGDFGLVRSDDGDDATELTQVGTAIGTLGYLAPERLRGDSGGPPSDVFALATIAHLGLTGSLPRPAGSVRDLVAAAPFRAPAVSAVTPALGTAFDEPILAGLAIDPGRRPDAVMFGARLAAALGAWSRAGRPGAAGATGAGGGTALATGTGDRDWSSAGATRGRPEPGPDDATTAIAIPIEPTGRFATAPASADPRPANSPSGARATAPLALGVLLVFGGLLGLAALIGAALGPHGPSTPAAQRAPAVAASPEASSPPASASPSPSPNPTPTATPSPTPDPALAALDRLDAAIAGARGGRDGLKGKDANELEDAARRIRADLADGDREKARKDARDLARRVDHLPKGLRDDAKAAIREATSALLAALED
jgi:serine/threonine-protein kinase